MASVAVLSTGIVVTTVLVEVLITDTLLLSPLVTYAKGMGVIATILHIEITLVPFSEVKIILPLSTLEIRPWIGSLFPERRRDTI
ncbi:hypothetical protein PDK32_15000 [Bacillus cereus]|nr:hypothetical protein [Bacillus cereus]